MGRVGRMGLGRGDQVDRAEGMWEGKSWDERGAAQSSMVRGRVLEDDDGRVCRLRPGECPGVGESAEG